MGKEQQVAQEAVAPSLLCFPAERHGADDSHSMSLDVLTCKMESSNLPCLTKGLL